ncbi:CHAD domain-containing protein [Trichothermofontia sp.]
MRAKVAMAKASIRDSPTPASQPVVTATVEQYVCSLIQKYYHRLVSREALVLKDDDPEDLHQMRVSIRRLQTALQIFQAAIDLPKVAQVQSLQAVTKRLGKLRDLDVQLETLKTDYADKLDPSEHSLLTQAIAILTKYRKKAFAQVKTVLKGERYQAMKAAYEAWLAHPHYTPVAQQPLQLVLPDLLSPLLSALLLHPGWLIAADDEAAIASPTLHDLRKTCKHVRYQAEFFTDFYEPAFQEWIQEIKGLQDSLGAVHDLQVLQQILIKSVPEWEESVHLRQMIMEQHEMALSFWRSVQAKYLSAEYRLFLHQLLLSPLFPRQSEALSVAYKVEGAAITPPPARLTETASPVSQATADGVAELTASDDQTLAPEPTIRRKSSTAKKTRTPRVPRSTPSAKAKIQAIPDESPANAPTASD